jgi:hypothetical protein
MQRIFVHRYRSATKNKPVHNALVVTFSEPPHPSKINAFILLSARHQEPDLSGTNLPSGNVVSRS